MVNPTIRLAAAGDAALVRIVSAEAYTPAYQAIIGAVPKPASEAYDDWIKAGNVWLAELDGEAVGVLVLEPLPDHLMVYSIAVLPGHQGTGLGKVLLSFAETQALNKGYAEVRLYTNPRIKRNVSFYRHHGFVEIGTRPHPSRPGQNVVDMAKEVASGATAH